MLTKHTLVLGATGSGKTVLCKAIIEEAALRGIPVLAIDPKGDISCLAISSKNFQFRPYSDVEADIQKRPREEFANELQSLYAEKTSESGISQEKVARFADTVEVRIYTPKSSAGIPVSISPKLDPPPQISKLMTEQPNTVADLLDLSVNSLLNIVNPERSGQDDQQAVSYISAILEDQWKKGNSVDLRSLIDFVQRPPFEKVGNLSLDQIFSRKERIELAKELNLFSTLPKLRAWTLGEPLDFDRLFDTTRGKTPVNVVNLSGIQSQEERLFFVETLLTNLYSWIMKQQGVQNLRFLLYFDEVVEYCPPVREPPSKKSLLLLIKQARAFGLGIILATQNPIDVDYKVISNANVRLIGRLSTERDVDRVKDGLELPEDSAITIKTLEKGQFLYQIFDPRSSGIISPRWLMTYHRGPLMIEEIGELMKDFKEEEKFEKPIAVVSKTPLEEGDEEQEEEPVTFSREPLQTLAAPPIATVRASPTQLPNVDSPAPMVVTVLGIPFALTPEEVPDRVKKQRKIFGQPEIIGEVKQVYRQILELGIGVRTGVLSKKYQTKYLFMDAATGRGVELGKKLALKPGLEALLGLDSRDVEVLRSLDDDKYSSAHDLAGKLKISVDLVRDSLRELERRRLAKSMQMGRAKGYQRITNMPSLDLKEEAANVSSMDENISVNITAQKGTTEVELRELVRGLHKDYDLVSYRPFYYPLYSVALATRNTSRTVWIDGATSEETQV